VRDRQPCAQHLPAATIEKIQVRLDVISQPGLNALDQPVAYIACSESLAFNGEECQLIEWIDGPKPRIELKAVDDADPIVEPNVLRSEITVAVNDPAAPNTIENAFSALREECAQNSVDTTNDVRGHAEPGLQQNAAIVVQQSRPADQFPAARREHRSCMAIELSESLSKGVQLEGEEPVPSDSVLESKALIQAPHDNQPINDLTFSPDRDSKAGPRDGLHIEIHIAGKPPIEPQLCPACSFATFESGEVEIGKAHGLLEFVHSIPGKKDPGHVSFAQLDAATA
jgi:hypothetical protein